MHVIAICYALEIFLYALSYHYAVAHFLLKQNKWNQSLSWCYRKPMPKFIFVCTRVLSLLSRAPAHTKHLIHNHNRYLNFQRLYLAVNPKSLKHLSIYIRLLGNMNEVHIKIKYLSYILFAIWHKWAAWLIFSKIEIKKGLSEK